MLGSVDGAGDYGVSGHVQGYWAKVSERVLPGHMVYIWSCRGAWVYGAIGRRFREALGCVLCESAGNLDTWGVGAHGRCVDPVC